MTDRPKPLTEGEHVDLDSGLTIKRTHDDAFRLSNGRGDRLTVTRADLDTLTALAGPDPEDDDGE